MCDAGVRKSRAEGVRASSAELRITRSMLMECPAFIVPVEKWKPHEADDPDDHARPGGCVLRQPQGSTSAADGLCRGKTRGKIEDWSQGDRPIMFGQWNPCLSRIVQFKSM